MQRNDKQFFSDAKLTVYHLDLSFTLRNVKRKTHHITIPHYFQLSSQKYTSKYLEDTKVASILKLGVKTCVKNYRGISVCKIAEN